MTEEPRSNDPRAREVEAEQRLMFDQYEAATNAIWEIVSPATTATGPGNIGDPDYQEEVYQRAWLSARAAAPNFDDANISRWVESHMQAAFGGDYHRNLYNAGAGLTISAETGLPVRAVDPDLLDPMI